MDCYRHQSMIGTEAVIGKAWINQMLIENRVVTDIAFIARSERVKISRKQNVVAAQIRERQRSAWLGVFARCSCYKYPSYHKTRNHSAVLVSQAYGTSLETSVLETLHDAKVY